MNKKTLLLLGGSPLQVDLLRKAKERYHVIVVDGSPFCALRGEADEFAHLDFSDTTRLESLARTKSAALILTMASEPGNLSAAIVSERLGLTYNPTAVVFETINKLRMKKRLIDSSIPTARYLAIPANSESVNLTNGLIFPVVVKPSQSSAGRGVKLVSDVEDLERAVMEAKHTSRDACALVEEFIQGNQFSVETISCSGRHSILGITREYFGPEPFFAETQQMFPANLDHATETSIHQLILKTLDAFKIQYGACHIEVRLTPKGDLYIIEIASRIGGWRSELIRKANGVEYCELLLKAHENRQPVIQKSHARHSIVKMLFNRADLERQRLLENDPSYIVSPTTWLKDSIGETQNSLMDSAGYYFVETSTLEDALNAL